jgi:hypothetical protein
MVTVDENGHSEPGLIYLQLKATDTIASHKLFRNPHKREGDTNLFFSAFSASLRDTVFGMSRRDAENAEEKELRVSSFC